MTPKLPDQSTEEENSRPRLIDEDLTGKVIGAFYTVYNKLGYGFRETVYSRALTIELRRRGLRVDRESRSPCTTKVKSSAGTESITWSKAVSYSRSKRVSRWSLPTGNSY